MSLTGHKDSLMKSHRNRTPGDATASLDTSLIHYKNHIINKTFNTNVWN